jgi:sulfate/thiosulfate transport system ATP-binding protein
MNHGRIEQVGPRTRSTTIPDSPFVYDFIGSVNRFRAHVHQGQGVRR